MKLFIHVGMNKAGSTSIQNTLSNKSDYFLDKYKILYPSTVDNFNNHFNLYKLASLLKISELTNYIDKILNEAHSKGATSIVLSSEDLFLLPNLTDSFNTLLESLNKHSDVEKRIILVARDPRSWMKSYITQLFSNGAFAIDENSHRYLSLASNIVTCTKAYMAYDPNIGIISYQSSQKNGTLIADFFQKIGIEITENLERIDNQTGAERFLSVESLIGIICGLRAFNYAIHPNSTAIDKFRMELRQLTDALSQTPDVSHLINPLEKNLQHDVAMLIEKSISLLSEEDIHFLDSLEENQLIKSGVVLPKINHGKFENTSVRFSFVNMPDELFGLVKLNLLIQSPSFANSSICLILVGSDGKEFKKIVHLDANGLAEFWYGMHTHLFKNGYNIIRASILNEDAVTIWYEDIKFSVSNTGILASNVSASLHKNNVPLLIESCDTATYDYEDSSLLAWFDRPDALDTIDTWIKQGKITAFESNYFRQFVTEGYMIFENLIDNDLISDINAEIDLAVESGYQGYKDGTSQRITNLHNIYPNIGKLFLDRRYLDIVDKVFQASAKPCQSLTYKYGSQQDAHQDTIHLTPFPAGYMCGVWISLEDIKPDSGELEVYPKSHRLPRIYMNTVSCEKVKKDWSEFNKKIVSRWRADLNSNDFEKVIYRPKKGTVLVWHENLMHGGSIRNDPSLSRRSIVFHCFADGAIVFYDSTGEVGFVTNPKERK